MYHYESMMEDEVDNVVPLCARGGKARPTGSDDQGE